MENTREFTIRVLRRYEVRTKKSLGQNFLIDDGVIDRIISNVPDGSTVLEIGPGMGALTRRLVEKAGRVIAVEIDSKLCEILKEEIDSKRLEVVNEDFLDIDLNEVLAERAIAVANIPYYITSPIISKLLTSADMVETAVLMMQREVAERVVARPGGKEYGILSIVAALYSEPEILFYIPESAFIPPPRVESCVVRFNKRKRHLRVSEKDLLRVVKVAFSKRRKTIVNTLANLFNGDKDEFKEYLKEAGIDPMARPETLGIEQFEEITGIIFKKS